MQPVMDPGKPLVKRAHSPAAVQSRSSFSSIREHDCDYAQTFTLSKVSSYSQISQISQISQQQQYQHQRQHQQQQPCSCQTCLTELADESACFSAPSSPSLVPCNMLPFAQNGDVSCLDLAGYAPDADFVGADVVSERAQLERLPLEIFHLIVDHLVLDTPPNGIDRRNVDLMALLVTSRTLYATTLETLYRRVTIPHSRIFQKFLAQIEAAPPRGAWVRRLDFSHFNPVSLFASASERGAARNLTADTLLRCLHLTPDLREFLAQDYIDTDLDEDVLRKLFLGLPGLQALDLCGCSSVPFRNAFASFLATASTATDSNGNSSSSWPSSLGIQRLSLHKCITLPSAAFECLLPRLNRLTHLDVAGTRITDAALHSIPASARISHLNLAKCSLLTPDAVIDFLARHPAVNGGDLVFLSLSFDAATAQLLSAADVSRLLSVLPSSLKSLSLKGSKMDHSHVPQLQALCKHLEELALGRCLDLVDVKALVVAPEKAKASSTDAATAWTPHSLRYLDLSDMSADEFDLSFFYIDSQLLGPAAVPLEVIEVSEDIFKRVTKSKAPLARNGWRQSEIGARSWLVRGLPAGGRPDGRPTASFPAASFPGTFAMENGQRPWKMGAQSWGMRKIPVAHAKVGGMYGSYMFGRKL